MANFETEYRRALSASSFTGGICKLTGAISSFLAIVLAFIAAGSGYGDAFLGLLAIAAVLLVAGAPLIAFGTITNEQRKQTALLALQTWQQQRTLNPELGDFPSSTPL